MHLPTSAVAALVAVAPLAFAQTSTNCNPMKRKCPPDPGLPLGHFGSEFTSGASSIKNWSPSDQTKLQYNERAGAIFTIRNGNDAPTIQTDFYVFGARVDVTMRAAPGKGIVSSIVLESDDLDEIDWEFLGGSPYQVQSNFFGKGNTSVYNRAQIHQVADTQSEDHMYSISWNHGEIEFLIDGAVVRTVPYISSDTVQGNNYPQTPMRLKLGSWAGGASTNPGTVGWAGGKSDFRGAPYEMYVKSVDVTNFQPACEYEYTDKSGSWNSIKIIQSTASNGACSNSGSSSKSGSGKSGSTKSGSKGSKEGSREGSGGKGKGSGSGQTASSTTAAVVAPISEQTMGFTSLPPAKTSVAASAGGSRHHSGGSGGGGGGGNTTLHGSGHNSGSSSGSSVVHGVNLTILLSVALGSLALTLLVI